MGKPRPGHFYKRSRAKRTGAETVAELPPRKLELALNVGGGFNDKEIAGRMGLALASVRVMTAHLYARLGLQTWGNPRVRLALLAAGAGHVQEDGFVFTGGNSRKGGQNVGTD